MSKLLLAIAAILTLAILLAHVFLGGPMVVPPLLGTGDIPEEVRWLAYFNWHAGSVSLVVCASALGFATLRPRQLGIAIFAALILSGFAILGLGMASFGNPVLWGTPAPYAFGVIALIAWAGILTHRTGAT